MFSWYRWSSLTIVHLSDVFDGGSLAGSVWFTRGWTLQELLASRTSSSIHMIGRSTPRAMLWTIKQILSFSKNSRMQRE
ncbi:hypothetical protein EDD16DRAFT_1682144 [Pisolithus croceorrhizus]|nr:hypothetical protein EDD16DRAFT_1682144 [Pisolithus croceorrhizus]